jgi:hypothetical protein
MPCHADVTEPRYLKLAGGTPLPFAKAMMAFLSGTDHGCTGGNPIPDEPGGKAGMACFLAFKGSTSLCISGSDLLPRQVNGWRCRALIL